MRSPAVAATCADTRRPSTRGRCVLLALAGLVVAAGCSGSEAGTDAPVPVTPGGQDGGPGAPPAAVRLAFHKGRSGSYDVWTVALDGGAAEPLTSAATNELYPAWSPDGRWLAFTSNREGSYGLYVRDLSTGEEWQVETRLATGDLLYSATTPAFSPDGAWLAFEGRTSATLDADVYRVRVVEGRAAGPAEPLTGHAWRDVAPAWGPDGRSLYFVSNRSGAFEVWVMGADGAEQRRLTTGARVLGRPAVSPLGNVLAYAQPRQGPGSQVVLHHIALDGAGQPVLGEPRTLSAQDDSEPAFLPDGRQLAVASQRAGDAEVLLLDVESGAVVARFAHEPSQQDGAPAFMPATTR